MTNDTDFRPSETPPEIADEMAAAHAAEAIKQADERDAPIIDYSNPREFSRIVDKLDFEFNSIMGYRLNWASQRGQDIFQAKCSAVSSVLRDLAVTLQVALDPTCGASRILMVQEPKL